MTGATTAALVGTAATTATATTAAAAATAGLIGTGGAMTLGGAATLASIGGSILSGLGQMQAGKAAKANANFQSAQMEQQAGQERASSQREAIALRRQSAIMQSNAQAASAASGGGATDPTVLNITGNLAREGEYNALSALFAGEERARGQKLQAASTRIEGKQAQKQGYSGGAATIIGGIGSSVASRYAPSAPVSSASTGTTLPWQAPGNVKPSYLGGGYY